MTCETWRRPTLLKGCLSPWLPASAAQLQPAFPAFSSDCTARKPARRSPWSLSLHAPAARCDPWTIGQAGTDYRSSGRFRDEAAASTIESFSMRGFFPARSECAWRFPDQDRFQSSVLETSECDLFLVGLFCLDKWEESGIAKLLPWATSA